MKNNTLAVVFPGQGSQSVGMLSDIAAAFPEIEQTFAQASAVLNYDLWQLVKAGPAVQLDNTTHTQPALLAASYAIWQILKTHTKIQPAYLAGHSLGEYTALVCAEAISFSDAVKLVAARGQFMQEAVSAGVGAMGAIIGLDEAQVNTICEQAITTKDDILSPANFNSIGQIVVAGHKAPVERALQLAKAHGAKMAVLIPVSVPSHCQLMKPAAARLAVLLQEITIKHPLIPILNNVASVPYTDISSIREGLIKQLYLPVRWVEIIQALVQFGIAQIIECGPGKVLSGLSKRIDKHLQLSTTQDLASLQAILKRDSEGGE